MDLLICLILLIVILPTTYAAVIGAPIVPSAGQNIDKALKEAGVGKSVRFCELGTGGGGVSRRALLMGAEVTGYELSPIAFIWSFTNLASTGKPFKLVFKNFFREGLSRAQVMYAFLLPESMQKLRKKLEAEALPGTILISYAFPIPEWTPYKKVTGEGEASIYIYEIGEKTP